MTVLAKFASKDAKPLMVNASMALATADQDLEGWIVRNACAQATVLDTACACKATVHANQATPAMIAH